jgi:hypothetical protein
VIATSPTDADIRALLAVAFLGVAAAQTVSAASGRRVRTEKGTIELSVDPVRAPATAANFLKVR